MYDEKNALLVVLFLDPDTMMIVWGAYEENRQSSLSPNHRPMYGLILYVSFSFGYTATLTQDLIISSSFSPKVNLSQALNFAVDLG